MQKVLEVKEKELSFPIIEPIIYGSFKANTQYKLESSTETELHFREINDGVREEITINKNVFNNLIDINFDYITFQ